MSTYKKILVAVELNAHHDAHVVERAKALANQSLDNLYVVHAVERVGNYGIAAGFYAITELEHQLAKEHTVELEKFASKHKMHKHNLYIVMGSPTQAIPELARKISADLIVVGSHNHPILSSTADSILHHAKCDILAVKLPG